MKKIKPPLLVALVSVIVVIPIVIGYYSFYFYQTLGMTKIATVENYVVYTDKPQLKKDILLVMDTCLSQLKEKNIHTKTKQRIVFCSTHSQYDKKTLFLHQNTLGLNYPAFNTIFLSPADYKNNRQQKYDERLINRKLSDAIVHEVTHLYIREKIGYLRNTCMSRTKNNWKIEGFCDYVANSSSFNIEEGTNIFLNEASQSDTLLDSKLMKATYFYFKSRLKTDYLFSCKHVSFDEFMRTKWNEKELENEIRTAITSQEYSMDKQ